MKTTVEWVDDVKARLDLPSDYAAAKALGVTRSTVSKYRTGQSVFQDATAIRAAEILGIHPFEIIAATRAERSQDERAKAIWRNALRLFSCGNSADLSAVAEHIR
ncbi:transcriptional regulator with XRE-family HTH domain [Paraburkholderia sp. CI2]|uniref:helix-turn-helix domain-containing protein n=1 Tax=Paraburkholderia sp. CI2 TaxID=2723093 RepID=UPI00160F235F|nr:helix-turn-helix domain-containing protein [Paraburkholderia sp. CI2]MBB5469201.1 transcriptional regulator with XRE-family HTH domain [Paraburkholderia sp. CI2]